MSLRGNVYYNTRVGDFVVTMKTSGDFTIGHTRTEGGIRITAQEFTKLVELFGGRAHNSTEE